MVNKQREMSALDFSKFDSRSLLEDLRPAGGPLTDSDQGTKRDARSLLLATLKHCS